MSPVLDQWTAFRNVVPTLPTKQFSHQATLLEEVYSDYIQLPLESQDFLLPPPFAVVCQL